MFAMIISRSLYSRDAVGWQAGCHGVDVVGCPRGHGRKNRNPGPHLCGNALDGLKNFRPRWRRCKRTLVWNVVENLSRVCNELDLNLRISDRLRELLFDLLLGVAGEN